MKVNGKDDIPYIMENKIHVWNHQPDHEYPMDTCQSENCTECGGEQKVKKWQGKRKNLCPTDGPALRARKAQSTGEAKKARPKQNKEVAMGQKYKEEVSHGSKGGMIWHNHIQVSKTNIDEFTKTCQETENLWHKFPPAGQGGNLDDCMPRRSRQDWHLYQHL